MLLLSSVILIALVALPFLWWPRRNALRGSVLAVPHGAQQCAGAPPKGPACLSVRRYMSENQALEMFETLGRNARTTR